MFLFYKRMACVVYLRELTISTLIYSLYIVAISYCKSIRSIDKINSYKLSTCCNSEDKQVRRYCNNNDYKIKDRLNIITSQTNRKTVSAAVD